jgi:transcriptional regulator with XRE-family HTH domain
MTPSELVGRRIAEARQERGMTQEELGQALAPYLGRPMVKQTVSLIEGGTREVSVTELLAMALVLVRPLHWFIRGDYPQDAGDTVTFPGGERVSGIGVVLLVMEHLPPLETQEAASAFVLQTAEREAEIVKLAGVIRDAAATNERVLRHLVEGETTMRPSALLRAEGTVTKRKKRPQRRPRKGGNDAAK